MKGNLSLLPPRGLKMRTGRQRSEPARNRSGISDYTATAAGTRQAARARANRGREHREMPGVEAHGRARPCGRLRAGQGKGRHSQQPSVGTGAGEPAGHGGAGGGRGVLELPPLPVQPGHTESSPCWPRKLLPGLCPETISPEQGPPWSSAGDREGSPTQVERDALGRGSHISPVMGIQIKNYNTPKNTHHPEPEPENVRSWGKWSTECCVGETEASG